MKIVIIGDGKVGHKLTTQLSEENYDIVLPCSNANPLLIGPSVYNKSDFLLWQLYALPPVALPEDS